MIRLLMFLGRHGHQQANVMMEMETRDVVAFAEELGWLIEQEAEAWKKTHT